MAKEKSSRNKTIISDSPEVQKELKKILKTSDVKEGDLTSNLNKIFNGKLEEVLPLLPAESVDLIVTDPPYNLSKVYNGTKFNKRGAETYKELVDAWIDEMVRVLKPTGTLYICSDWQSSTEIYLSLRERMFVKNRITWARDKGRGAKGNWKNNIEDIWFATKSNKEYTFNDEDVKIKKQVIAPYVNEDNLPKDWFIENGVKYRLTGHSNIWTDITIPFWSMAENTEHPTQKPEKLIAKLILASSNEGDVVLDPFMGSGTTAVVAKKLNRNFIGVELEPEYVAIGNYRVNNVKDNHIQGYNGEYFLERNEKK